MRVLNLQSFHIGVDLGQRADYTAIVVVEQRVESTSVRDPQTFEYQRVRRLVVRKAVRLRLGTAYRKIVREVKRLTECAEFQWRDVTTTVDATGLGSVVTEGLREVRLKGELFPVVITGGQQGKYKDGYFPTPRTELLLGVQQALEVDGLAVAQGVKGWEALEEELKSLRKFTGISGPRFESDGQHDDLVFALALALFGARMQVLPVQGEAVRRKLDRW